MLIASMKGESQGNVISFSLLFAFCLFVPMLRKYTLSRQDISKLCSIEVNLSFSGLCFYLIELKYCISCTAVFKPPFHRQGSGWIFQCFWVAPGSYRVALVPNETNATRYFHRTHWDRSQRLMSRWKYLFSYDQWSQASWAQPVFRWVKLSGEWRELL